MKYLIALLLLWSAHSSAGPVLSLVPSSSVVGLNEMFSVDLLFSNGTTSGASAFGFDVASGVGLNYLGATVNPSFFDLSEFIASTDVYGATIGAIGGTNFPLSTLYFVSGFTPGVWDIRAVSRADDLGLQDLVGAIYSIDEAVTIEVVGPTAVSLPSTLALSMLGFLAGVYKRKKV